MVETGIRRVGLVVTDKQRRQLPRVINFEDGHAILIVCPGRAPVCLVCGAEGHTRAITGCPMKVDKARFGGRRTWADVAAGKSGGGGDAVKSDTGGTGTTGGTGGGGSGESGGTGGSGSVTMHSGGGGDGEIGYTGGGGGIDGVSGGDGKTGGVDESAGGDTGGDVGGDGTWCWQ